MLTVFQQQKLPRLFAVHDLNGDGVINRVDFEEYTRRIAGLRGWGPESMEYNELLARFFMFWHGLEDIATGKGVQDVTITEWFEYWDRILNTPGVFDAVITPIGRMIFTMLDEDGDGSITADEYAAIYRSGGLDPAEAIAAFSQLDLDRDGQLSIDEIMVHADEFFRSDDPNAPGNALFGIVPAPARIQRNA